MTEAEYRQALAEAHDTILFIVRENVMIKRQAAALRQHLDEMTARRRDDGEEEKR